MTDFTGVRDIRGWFLSPGRENDVVVSTRSRLSRNLDGMRFPGTMSPEEAAEAADRIRAGFTRIPDAGRYRYVNPASLGPRERKTLVERNLISPSAAEAEGTALLVRDDAGVSCTVNDIDHLRIQSIRAGFDLDGSYGEVDRLESQLDDHLGFAVSLDWGYLNTEIRNTGTGLRVSAMLHLPALAATSLIERTVSVVSRLGLSVKGFLIDGERSLGDMYQVSNQVGIGLSERDILEKLEGVVLQLVNYERKARGEMVETRSIGLEDSVWRAYGILRYAKSVSSREAIELLSALRLGISLGFIKEVPLQTVTSLLFFTQDAHMGFLSGAEEGADITDIDSARAALIHEFLVSNTLRGGTDHV